MENSSNALNKAFISPSLEFKIDANSSFWVLAKLNPSIIKSLIKGLSEYTNPKIEVQSKKIINENYTIVNSVLVSTSDRPEVKIDWRIYTKNPDNPLIRDLIIEGLSLARTQKEEFASILNSNDGDINALFKTLENFTKN